MKRINGNRVVYSRFSSPKRGFFYGPVGAGRFGLLVAFLGLVLLLAALLCR